MKKINLKNGTIIAALTLVSIFYLSSALYHGSFISTCTFTEGEVPYPL